MNYQLYSNKYLLGMSKFQQHQYCILKHKLCRQLGISIFGILVHKLHNLFHLNRTQPCIHIFCYYLLIRSNFLRHYILCKLFLQYRKLIDILHNWGRQLSIGDRHKQHQPHHWHVKHIGELGRKRRHLHFVASIRSFYIQCILLHPIHMFCNYYHILSKLLRHVNLEHSNTHRRIYRWYQKPLHVQGMIYMYQPGLSMLHIHLRIFNIKYCQYHIIRQYNHNLIQVLVLLGLLQQVLQLYIKCMQHHSCIFYNLINKVYIAYYLYNIPHRIYNLWRYQQCLRNQRVRHIESSLLQNTLHTRQSYKLDNLPHFYNILEDRSNLQLQGRKQDFLQFNIEHMLEDLNLYQSQL